jgi:diaminohydroxyphosphoribosylaminopyrimidine deaminase/5-amino-6-(5-phosphoribosylamino)uracil reductase
VHVTAPTLDETFLRRLFIELGQGARVHRFEVAPNPCVGAAVLAGSRVVARGFHEVWGGPHAEVQALDAAERSGVPPQEWDTLVVTLEPCCSSGKTPPCTERILRCARSSGLRRLLVGAQDPDPRHRGAGIEALREAGLEVIALPQLARLETISPHFLRWTTAERLRRARPWTIAKWAQTRSGQLSPPLDVGEGRWISGPEALAEVQVLRGRVDAIVTGVSTVLADDPRLTVRPPGDVSRPPLRVVLDSYLRTPPEARLFADPGPGEGGGEVHVLCQAGANAMRHRALEAVGAHVTGLHPSEEDHVRLRDVQEWLWQHGATRIVVESGPELLSRYLQMGFVDQLRVYTGEVNGGRGESMARWFTDLRLDERLDREVGGDSVLEAFLK